MRGHACSDAVTVRSAMGARERGRVTRMISGVMDCTFAAPRPSVVGGRRVRVVVVVVRIRVGASTSNCVARAWVGGGLPNRSG